MLKRKLPLLAAGHHPLSSTVVFSMMTFISRVLGYLRDSVIMISFGAGTGTGTGADAFLVAFRLPNFLRRLFAEGAFIQAFVPVFRGIQKNPLHSSHARYAGLHRRLSGFGGAGA